VLDLRLYRVTLLPFAILVAIAAFSLQARPATPPAASPPQGINGANVLAAAQGLAAANRALEPGSAGDDSLAQYVAGHLAPCPLEHAGCSVRVIANSVATANGTRTIHTVVASRVGAGGGIALIADRGGQASATAAGLAPTELLLQLAPIFRSLVPTATTPALTLVSTSGGASAMSAVAADLPPGTEAAIVLGNVSSASGRGPYVVPWSQSGALAPIRLRTIVEAAVASALGRPVGDVSFGEELARLALPLTTGAQGTLQAAGVPAVLVGTYGEAQPPAGQAADPALLAAFGQALLTVTATLDAAPPPAQAPTRDLAVGTQVLGGWAARAVIGALLLSLIACALDVLARARRRRAAVGRWCVWVLSCAGPFLLAGLFAAFLGKSGLLPATPAAPVTPAQMPISAAGAAALGSVGLALVLAWVLHAVVTAASSCKGAPEPVGAASALLLCGAGVGTLLWLENPYTAALVVVPLHLWLVVLTREQARPPLLGALYAALSLLPFAAVLAVVCAALHTEPLALLWTLLLLVASGGLSAYAVVLASLAAGLLVAAATILVRAPAAGPTERIEVTVRGPLGYAGPGSLGGTPSALRR
jgi:hypothetical protein